MNLRFSSFPLLKCSLCPRAHDARQVSHYLTRDTVLLVVKLQHFETVHVPLVDAHRVVEVEELIEGGEKHCHEEEEQSHPDENRPCLVDDCERIDKRDNDLVTHR